MTVFYARPDWIAGELLCHECGHTLEPPCVAWQGATLLLFHAECAREIAPHLLMDARECELATVKSPVWRRRARAVIRHRLVAEELVA